MENFISGYPGCEFQIRAALAGVIGPEKSAFFFDKVCGPNHCSLGFVNVARFPSSWSISSKRRMPSSSKVSG